MDNTDIEKTAKRLLDFLADVIQAPDVPSEIRVEASVILFEMLIRRPSGPVTPTPVDESLN